MFLSKVTPSVHYIHKLKRKFAGNMFWEHQMIWNLFENAPEQNRDFLYRREDAPGKLPFYYLLSSRLPSSPGGELDTQSKKYSPVLQSGDRLQFSLRANAVITKKVDESSKRRIRRDIIEARVDEYKQQFPRSEDRPPPHIIHHEAAKTWLDRQAKNSGFSLLELLVENHLFHKVRKPDDPNIRRFTSLDIHGQLLVDDPGKFNSALTKGLGRSRAFGCGLMLVQRI